MMTDIEKASLLEEIENSSIPDWAKEGEEIQFDLIKRKIDESNFSSRTINYTNSFKKTSKKHKNEYKEKELDNCLQIIADGGALDKGYKDHELRKPWLNHKKAPYREFHITHRLCVVYLINKNFIDVLALGTHKELGLAESLIVNG